jgi:hypothetical protein
VNTGERNGKKEKEPGLSSLFQGLLSLWDEEGEELSHPK